MLKMIGASMDLLGHAIGHAHRLSEDVVRDSRRVAETTQELADTASEAAVAIRDAGRATPRTLRIAGEAARLAASYRIHWAAANHMTEEAAQARLNQVHAANAARITAACQELGGGVLKLGQLLSCRADLLPRVWTDQLGTLTDQATPECFDAILAALQAELDPVQMAQFAHIDPEPLGAASLAQVHAATLLDGRDVAIKVQRPGIEDVVKMDARALVLAAPALEGVLPGIDAVTIAREVSKSLVDELDFKAEAVAMDEMAGHFAENKRLLVPRSLPELSNARVLTMTRATGQRLTDWLDTATDDQKNAFFETLIDSFAAQVLRYGLVHADPHPGNFLVTPDNHLVMLDFGAVQRYTPQQRKAWAELMGAILTRDFMRVAELLETLGFRSTGDDPDALVSSARLMLAAFQEELGGDLSQIDPRAQMEAMMHIARSNPIAVPGEFVMLGRVFAALGGLVMAHKPQVNLFGLVSVHLAAALSVKPEIEMAAEAAA